MAAGNAYTRNTKTFAMHWAMCDRGSATFAASQGILCDDDRKQQTFNIYCYGQLTPQEFYVRDWFEMSMEDVDYIANADPIKRLLAKQTKFSSKSGHGSSAAENWELWNDDFNREWAEGDMEKIILPHTPLPVKRLKFKYVCLQPETQMYKDAYDKDHPSGYRLALPQRRLDLPSALVAIVGNALHLMANVNGLRLVRHRPNLLHERTAILQVCHVREQHLARLIGLDVVETRQRV